MSRYMHLRSDSSGVRTSVSRSWKRSGILHLLALGQIAALLLMMERPAHAYVDPGSGLLAFQMIGASVAGALFLARRKLRQIFGGGETDVVAKPGATVKQDIPAQAEPARHP